MQHQSKREQFLALPLDVQQAFTDSLTDEQLFNLYYDWNYWARPKQQIPKDWEYGWLILAGRGFGKTRVGSETVRHFVENNVYKNIAIISSTVGDAYKVFVEGESGILKTARPDFMPTVNLGNTKFGFTWPNGAKATVFTSEAYDSLRGPQHDFIWFDEFAKYRYPEETFDQAMFGLRVGQKPRWMMTTTPKPLPKIVELIEDPDCIVTTGSTFENKTNLPAHTLAQFVKAYKGTRIGRQELYAEVLTDNPNALFSSDFIDSARIDDPKDAPGDYDRIIVAIDPAVTSNEKSDETGIIVAARKGDHAYILDDGTIKGTPDQWCMKAIQLYEHWGADRIVGEVNNGGDMIETLLRKINKFVSYSKVSATRGKAIRAEPIQALYEQGRVHHVGNPQKFSELESQMCAFDPTLGNKQKSPDRMDALVWAVSFLFTGKDKPVFFIG